MDKVKSIWIDGALKPFDEARLHFYTHTLHYGLGVFEGIRAYAQPDGAHGIFRLDAHIRRLFDSARICLMDMPRSAAEVMAACHAVLLDNGLTEAYLRPIAWLGDGSMGIGARNEIHIGVGAFAWGPYLGAEAARQGIRCCVSSLLRISHTSHMTRAKICGQYVNSVLAKRAATNSGYDEALLADADGHIVEGTGENLFMVRAGQLITPPRSSTILPGITRDTIMTLAREDAALRIEVVEQAIARDDLYLADEVFLTGTAAEVTPVREIDGRVIGGGAPGPVTRALTQAYGAVIHGRDPRHAAWVSRP